MINLTNTKLSRISVIAFNNDLFVEAFFANKLRLELFGTVIKVVTDDVGRAANSQNRLPDLCHRSHQCETLQLRKKVIRSMLATLKYWKWSWKVQIVIFRGKKDCQNWDGIGSGNNDTPHRWWSETSKLKMTLRDQCWPHWPTILKISWVIHGI